MVGGVGERGVGAAVIEGVEGYTVLVEAVEEGPGAREAGEGGEVGVDLWEWGVSELMRWGGGGGGRGGQKKKRKTKTKKERKEEYGWKKGMKKRKKEAATLANSTTTPSSTTLVISPLPANVTAPTLPVGSLSK